MDHISHLPLSVSEYQKVVVQRGLGEEQGDIESVAAMSPMGLTQLFEHISGSENIRKPSCRGAGEWTGGTSSLF
jgi:hypothetical protein